MEISESNAPYPTFPNDPIVHSEIPGRGLSKREYFAGLAMQGLLVDTHRNIDVAADQIRYRAQDAVKAADALIKELNKTKTDLPREGGSEDL